MSKLHEWAKAHKLEKDYFMYISECKEIEEECIAEGYPSNGDIYDMRVEILKKDYPEFFDSDFDEEDLAELREYRPEIFDD